MDDTDDLSLSVVIITIDFTSHHLRLIHKHHLCVDVFQLTKYDFLRYEIKKRSFSFLIIESWCTVQYVRILICGEIDEFQFE